MSRRTRRGGLLIAVVGAAAAATAAFAAPVLLDAPAQGQESSRLRIALDAEPPISAGSHLVTLPWGSGPAEVGLQKPSEGLTRGPEALAVAPDGRLAVLDGVNQRLLLLAPDGRPIGSIPIRLAEPRFLSATNVSVYVLDPEVDRGLIELSWAGEERASHRLPVLQMPITGLFARENRLFVEAGHDEVLELRLNEQRAGVDQTEWSAAPGRPLDRDGRRYAQATLRRGGNPSIDPAAAPGNSLPILDIEGGPRLEHLISLHGDGTGNPILGARLLQPEAGPAGSASILVARIPADGRNRSSAIRLCEGSFAYTGEPYTVGPRGDIYQPLATPEGYSILIHSLDWRKRG